MPYKQFTSKNIPFCLRNPILIDEHGLPRFWVIVWSIYHTTHLDDSTKTIKLRFIESLYHFSDELYEVGYLDVILFNSDSEKIGSLLEAFFISLINRNDIYDSTEEKWNACLCFVKDVYNYLNKNKTDESFLSLTQSRCLQLESLYGQLKIQKKKTNDILRSLPSIVVDELYEFLAPDSLSNPYKQNLSKWNAFVVFICGLVCGMRRGEILLLRVNSIKSEFDKKEGKIKFWLNIYEDNEDDEDDSRYNKPSIKTVHSVRQIPISELTFNIIQSYSENHRGKPCHPFLLNTQWNTPLSQETISYYFKKINNVLSSEAKKTLVNRRRKTSIRPHDLRHTCVVIRLNQLLKANKTMEEAIILLRPFFGWSKESSMPLKYARAVFEDRLANTWSSQFDERVEILRSIPMEL